MRTFTVSLFFFFFSFSLAAQHCAVADKLYPKAKLESENRQYREAFSDCRKLLKECPDYLPGILLWGDLFISTLDFDSAQIAFNRYVQLAPSQSIGWRKLAGVQFFRGNIDSSLLLLQKATVLNPMDTIAWYNIAEIHFRQNNLEQAEADFKKVLQMDTSDIRPRLRLCDIWLAQGKNSPCWEQVEIMKKSEWGNYDVIYTEASLLIQEKQYDRSKELLMKLLNIDSLEPAAHYSLAVIYEETNKYDLALAEYNKILTNDPEDPEAYFQRGNLLLELDQAQLAQADYLDAYQLDSSNIEILFQLGFCMYQMTLYTDAVQYYNRYIAKNAENPEAFFNRGNSYYTLQQFADAKNDYTKALSLEENIDFRYNRALCSYALNLPGNAIQDLSIYLKKESADTEAYYLRCLCYFAEGNHEMACTDCEMALFLGKEDIPAEILKSCDIKKKKKKK